MSLYKKRVFFIVLACCFVSDAFSLRFPSGLFKSSQNTSAPSPKSAAADVANFGGVTVSSSVALMLEQSVKSTKNSFDHKNPAKGILLYGHAGCGKSLISKALAKSLNAEIISLSLPDAGSDFNAQISSTFKHARKIASAAKPVVLVMEDLDRWAPRSGVSVKENLELNLKIASEIDKTLLNNSFVVPVGITNHLENLDLSILTSGRLDQSIFIDKPNFAVRKTLVSNFVQQNNLKIDASVEDIALISSGLSCADLKSLVDAWKSEFGYTLYKPIPKGLIVSSVFAMLNKVRSQSGMAEVSSTDSSASKLSFGSKFEYYPAGSLGYSMNDVALNSNATPVVGELVNLVANSEKAKSLGVIRPNGVLIHGPLGVGKTRLIKVLSSVMGFSLVCVNAVELLSSGGFEFFKMNLKASLDVAAQEANKTKSIVLFCIKDLELIAKKKGNGIFSEEILATFLQEIDLLRKNGVPIVIVGLSSSYDSLDESIFKYGRFDKKIKMSYPDFDSRVKIFELLRRFYSFDKKVLSQKVAMLTDGFSGSDIAKLCNLSGFKAANASRAAISMLDIESSLSDMCSESVESALSKYEAGSSSIDKEVAKFSIPVKYFPQDKIKFNLKNIIANPECKSQLTDVIDFIKNPEPFKKSNAKIPAGIIFYGPTGTGKTLMARAVAGQAGCSFFSVNASELTSKYLGESAKNIKSLFELARAESVRTKKPSILYIDELDAFAKNRSSSYGTLNDDNTQMLNQLLCEMDGFNVGHGTVIVLGSTNRFSVLDSAVLRPGRFDRKIYFGLPDKDLRKEIFSLYTSRQYEDGKYLLSSKVDLDEISEMTNGASGADIVRLLNDAAIKCAQTNQSFITDQMLKNAWQKMKSEVVSSLMSKHEQTSATAIDKEISRFDVPMRYFAKDKVKTTFKDVCATPSVKEEVCDIVDYIKNPEKFEALNAKIPSGLIFHGPTGTGKTLFARGIAGESGCSFFVVNASELVSKWVGDTGKNIKSVFDIARAESVAIGSPVILFIDEIDSIAQSRGSGHGSLESFHSQMLNQLLTEMDGFGQQEGKVIVIGATNRFDMLDSAILRPGRFDRKVYLGIPDLNIRKQIIDLYASKESQVANDSKKFLVQDSVDLNKFASMAVGASGADIVRMLNEAAIAAAKSGQKAISHEMLADAIQKVEIGLPDNLRFRNPKDLEKTAYHEAGHTLAGILSKHADPFQLVTIVPRGSALGVTWHFPEEDKDGRTKEELFAQIVVALGGMEAEKLIYNTSATGVSSDLKKANRVAEDMVCLYGMSDLGPVSEGRSRDGQLPDHVRQARNEIVQRAQKVCANLLSENEDKLRLIAEKLLEKETLYADEVYSLVGL